NLTGAGRTDLACAPLSPFALPRSPAVMEPMKAIVVTEFGGPDVMRVAEVPDPSPGPGQVVVRIRAAGVNPVDAYVRTGTYARTPPLPYTPGYDGAGDIEAVGSGVSNWRVGDRVWIAALGATHGTYAERIVCD